MVQDGLNAIEETKLLQTLVCVRKILASTKRLGDNDHWFHSTDVLLACYEQAVSNSINLIDEVLKT